MTNADTQTVTRLATGLARMYESVNVSAIKRDCATCDDPKASAVALIAELTSRGVIVRGKLSR